MTTLRLRFFGYTIIVLFVLMAPIEYGRSSLNLAASSDSNAADTSAPSLNDRLSKLREAFNAQAPPEIREIGQHQLDILRQSGILDSALNVGDTAPTFTLPDAVGDTVRSQDLLATGPIVLVLYRGVW